MSNISIKFCCSDEINVYMSKLTLYIIQMIYTILHDYSLNYGVEFALVINYYRINI